MSSNKFVDFQESSASIKCLATEDAAESAIVFETDNINDLVHSPSVEVLVRDDFERESVLNLVAMNGLERVVAVAGDSLVDGEEEEMEAVIVVAVEFGENVSEDGGILAAGSTDCDAFPWLEEGVVDYDLMNLRLESVVEAVSAYVL